MRAIIFLQYSCCRWVQRGLQKTLTCEVKSTIAIPLDYVKASGPSFHWRHPCSSHSFSLTADTKLRVPEQIIICGKESSKSTFSHSSVVWLRKMAMLALYAATVSPVTEVQIFTYPWGFSRHIPQKMTYERGSVQAALSMKVHEIISCFWTH